MSEFDLENLRRRQEEIKEEVEEFKKQRKGLLPEFSFPEEEIEEEKEYPEEMLFAFELRMKIEEYLPLAREVKDNALKEIESYLEKGKTNQESAVNALRGFSSLITLQKYFYEFGQKKLKQIEHQKALHPERKNIPPRPEARSF